MKKFFVGLTLFIASTNSSIFAQGMATFDFSNLIQNIHQVMTSTSAEINTYKTYIDNYRHYALQVQNMQKNLEHMGEVGNRARLGDIKSSYDSAMRMKKSTDQLRFAMKDQEDLVTGINRLINVSGLTPEKWTKREQALVKQKDANAVFLMKSAESSLKAIDEAARQREEVLAETKDEGIRAVAMKTNVMLGNLATVQSQTLRHLTSEAIAKTAETKTIQAEKNAKERDTMEFIVERLKRQENAKKIGVQK